MTGKPEVRVTDQNTTIKEKVLEWLFSQGVPAVLLFTLVGLFAYAVWVMVPVHLQQIQDGYKSINDSNNRTIEKLEAQKERELNRVIEVLTDRRAVDKTTFSSRKTE